MTDLDDMAVLRQLDPEGMLGHTAALHQQCRDAWNLTRCLDFSLDRQEIEKVLIAGLGGSAIGGDLASAVAADRSHVPIFVHRDYDLPAWADGQTLVIASSYSGNTEETLAAFEAGHRRGCPLVAVATGGALARQASEWNVPLVSFQYKSQPRAALGYLFISVLGILQASGIIGDLSADLEEGLAILETEGARLAPACPQSLNPAKQLASQLVGRVPVVVGAGHLTPVARRWKTQLNENSKSWAYFEALPEMDHNALSGIHFPAAVASQVCALFLSSAKLHARNRMRMDMTQQVFEGQGIVCGEVPIAGESILAQILAAVQLGDYVSSYLALRYGVNPTPIEDIVGLKSRMAEC